MDRVTFSIVVNRPHLTSIQPRRTSAPCQTTPQMKTKRRGPGSKERLDESSACLLLKKQIVVDDGR